VVSTGRPKIRLMVNVVEDRFVFRCAKFSMPMHVADKLFAELERLGHQPMTRDALRVKIKRLLKEYPLKNYLKSDKK
jgi:hypothetical protein